MARVIAISSWRRARGSIGRDAQLLLGDDVDAGQHFRDGVLDLQPRVFISMK